MIEYMKFWLAQALVNFGLYIALLAVIACLCLFCTLIDRVLDKRRNRRCKHERYRETLDGEAVCMNCGKDMGFIGAVREANPGGEQLPERPPKAI